MPERFDGKNNRLSVQLDNQTSTGGKKNGGDQWLSIGRGGGEHVEPEIPSRDFVFITPQPGEKRAGELTYGHRKGRTGN